MSHDKSCTRTYVPPADSAPCVSSPYRRVTVGRDPHAGKVVGVDFVLYELAPPFLVHVNAPRLSVVDLAAHHGGVGVGLHLEAGDAVPVDVAVLKVALRAERGGEETNHCSGLLRPPANPGLPTVQPFASYHAVVEGEHAHVAPVVDVVASDDGVAVVFHPDSRQRVVANLIIFVNSLWKQPRGI